MYLFQTINNLEDTAQHCKVVQEFGRVGVFHHLGPLRALAIHLALAAAPATDWTSVQDKWEEINVPAVIYFAHNYL